MAPSLTKATKAQSDSLQTKIVDLNPFYHQKRSDRHCFVAFNQHFLMQERLTPKKRVLRFQALSYAR